MNNSAVLTIPVDEIRVGQRPAEQEALHNVAAEIAQQVVCFLIFHALGHCDHVEIVGQIDNGTDELGVAARFMYVSNEKNVDLQFLRR